MLPASSSSSSSKLFGPRTGFRAWSPPAASHQSELPYVGISEPILLSLLAKFYKTALLIRPSAQDCGHHSLTAEKVHVTAVVARRLLTVDVTLSNYRRIENPLTGLSGLPFAMSNAWVQVSYASLLLFPFHLSCDYSYDCVPLVMSASDPRNVASLAFFAAILAASIQAARACTVRAHLHQPFALGMALLFIPMLPASNVFFLVGTFVAERLLYLPSCGLCVLIAACMSLEAKPGEGAQAGLTAKAAVAALVSAMAVRTVLRNRDWASEESLFASALKVCPRSAKVQLNSGILRRRKDDWEAAMQHFDRALEIEPDYCECKYWMGRTLLDMGNSEGGSELLRDAISCKWVTAEAAEALFRVFQVRINSPESDKGRLYEEWAEVLLEASSIASSVSGVDGQLTGGSSAAAVHFGKAAEAYISQGDAASAQKCYLRALGLSPGNCDFLLPLGELLDIAKFPPRPPLLALEQMFKNACSPC